MKLFYFKILSIILLLSLTSINSIYFLIHKSSTKCFFEEFFNESIISLRFNILDYLHEEKEHEHTPIFEFILYNLDKDTKVDTLQGVNPNGKVNFIIKENGSYTICVIPRPDADVFTKMEYIKFSMTLDTHNELTELRDYSEHPKDKDFEKINAKVQKMQSKVIDIMKSQSYQIAKEDDFIERQNNNTNAILYLTVVQIIILVVLTIWQASTFKGLFKDKILNIV
jgi:hypothetical protein